MTVAEGEVAIPKFEAVIVGGERKLVCRSCRWRRTYTAEGGDRGGVGGGQARIAEEDEGRDFVVTHRD